MEATQSVGGIEAALEVARARRQLPPPPVRQQIRLAADVTQRDCAGELGVTRVAFTRWETGRRTPRGAHLVAYVSLLRRLSAAAVRSA
jgi:DNA-binding transcriptional regulator YiaG